MYDNSICNQFYSLLWLSITFGNLEHRKRFRLLFQTKSCLELLESGGSSDRHYPSTTHGTSHSLHSNYKRLSGVFCKKGLICRVVTVSQEITNHDIRVAGRRRWYFQYSDTSCKHWIGTKNNMIIWSKLFKERITVRKWTKKSIASQRNYDAS